MTAALVIPTDGALAWSATPLLDPATIFEAAPIKTIADLFPAYAAALQQITEIAERLGPHSEIVAYFVEGNTDRHNRPSVERLFQRDGAVRALDAAYWQKALAMTDVYEAMPQDRRTEWSKVIDEHKAPTFAPEIVRSTIAELLGSRGKFFAERVDGVFRNLSGEHVTNRPEGFSKRMILSYVHDGSWPNIQRTGYISDLRSVVARFMGCPEPSWQSSSQVVSAALRQRGEWMEIDGGALRIRVYAKGTAHLEVHPEMAWRLNQILAHLHPRAIPAEWQRRPAKRSRDWRIIQRPLPPQVVDIIANMRPERHDQNAYCLGSYGANKMIRREARRVLESLGAVTADDHVRFEYDARPVLDALIASGCLPDTVAHQFYPTPDELVDRVIAEAGIKLGHTVLEPSAGQGAIADRVPEQVTCVEVSPLYCGVLRAKLPEAEIVEGDFLAWAPQQTRQFDRVVMNPPFADGRAEAHVQAAATRVAQGGRLVAVLPASMRDKRILGAWTGWTCRWSAPIAGAFAGTSAVVVILVADRVLA